MPNTTKLQLDSVRDLKLKDCVDMEEKYAKLVGHVEILQR